MAAGLPTKTEPEKLGLFASLARRFTAPRERRIRCFQCRHTQIVSTSATSTICPRCSSYIELQSYKISSAFSRTLRTQGEIVVTPTGELGSSKAYCSSAIIQGNVRGNLICSGEVDVRRRGKISGVIESDKVIIHKRSMVEFVRVMKVHDLEVNGRLDANIIASGTVHISSKGWLKGEVQALGFNVEKGGEFHGSLVIGKQATPEQGELLTSEPDVDAAEQTTLFKLNPQNA